MNDKVGKIELGKEWNKEIEGIMKLEQQDTVDIKKNQELIMEALTGILKEVKEMKKMLSAGKF